ncbi:MAG: bifunctional 5,10-methylenetetrahydrofolate dehydrogenase/5,10-methenyltetrahydrofolate cyclohydrolase [bacterium]|nr:bifunctional 5,10-methylenetetrahydrofolate dehydrogenase/5,10-methenyltetrahydrofolate cyclohydrolase [bacterium]
MLVDGKAIAQDIRNKTARALGAFSTPPQLAIVIVGENPVIESFVRIKKRVGESLSIPVIEQRFPGDADEGTVLAGVQKLANDKRIAGIIIQLPLPSHITAQKILDAVPTAKDVDMLASNSVAAFRRGDGIIIPPIAGAIQEILERHDVHIAGKDVLIIGHGRLVGVPAELFFRHNDTHVTVVGREVVRLGELTREADIIICGAGQQGLLQPKMLKPGVVVIDAGTSEQGGKIVGDADPKCADVASMFTPVPGGVGPIAVALIFKNLLVLAQKYKVEP